MASHRFVTRRRSDRAAARRLGGDRAPHATPRRRARSSASRRAGIAPISYPLYTPRGFPVVSEAPADHPHHNAFWIAADHVHCQMPAADNRIEEYTYNFYNDDTFQGRAPGRIVAVESTGEATATSLPDPPEARVARTVRMGGTRRDGSPRPRSGSTASPSTEAPMSSTCSRGSPRPIGTS